MKKAVPSGSGYAEDRPLMRKRRLKICFALRCAPGRIQHSPHLRRSWQGLMCNDKLGPDFYSSPAARLLRLN